MVWQVQHLKYPTLINLTARGPDCRIKLVRTDSHEAREMEVGRPFALYDTSGIREYEIVLDESRGGLIRMIYSRSRTTAEEAEFSSEASELSNLLMSERLSQKEITTIRRKFVGYADLEDFRIFGKFAVEHFPKISEEASKKPSKDIFGIVEAMNLNFLRYKHRLDYNKLQRDVISTFYNLFKRTAIERAGFPISRRGFNAEQIKILISLIEPLK